MNADRRNNIHLGVFGNAVVIQVGLIFFHLLSQDRLVSIAMLVVAFCALLAKATGGLTRKRSRLEYSIAASACLFAFIASAYPSFPGEIVYE